MIASAPTHRDEAHDQFLALLPKIRRQAALAFRSQPPDTRDDLIQEAVANAYVAYRRLVELGKRDIVFPTPLARYAVRQVRSGRRVGTRLNTRDVLSPANRRVVVESLVQFDPVDRVWKETLVEDRHAGPAETAAVRIDFARWFRSLPIKRRHIAALLAGGATTKAAARKSNLSPGRVSQVRRELEEAWARFQAEPVA